MAMGATIDFVEVSGGGYLIHMTAQPHVATVRHFEDRASAESERARLGGPYGYIISSLAELESAHVPALVLLSVHRLAAPIERFTTRKKIERKVWTIMSKMTKEEEKAAKAAEKAAKDKEAADKKAAAEQKKAAAAQKKADAEKAIADKKAAAEAKKAEAEAAKAEKKRLADEKKAAAAVAKQKTELAKSRINPAETITVLVDANPKREGSEAHKRFALYNNGMTVKEFLDAGGTMADITWDLGHRLISLTAPASS